MKITLIVEGKTEKAFLQHLRLYLKLHLLDCGMPKLDPLPYDGRIPTGKKLKRVVDNLLNSSSKRSDHVIALTDVYTGNAPHEFIDAADAKRKMREWVGPEKRFHPHAAQYDFEAWLLPYWSYIMELAGHNKTLKFDDPESINHNNPPAHRIKEIFEIGTRRDSYVKPRDASKILRERGLTEAVAKCSQLKALVNTILEICGSQPLA